MPWKGWWNWNPFGVVELVGGKPLWVACSLPVKFIAPAERGRGVVMNGGGGTSRPCHRGPTTPKKTPPASRALDPHHLAESLSKLPQPRHLRRRFRILPTFG